MNNVPAHIGGSSSPLPARVMRQLSREVAISQAHSAATAARQIAKIDAISEVTKAGMFAQTNLAELEGMLASEQPHAAPRLHFWVNQANFQMLGVLSETRRDLY